MKLHRLTLTDFRGVGRADLVLPESGVVVIEGPNEIGKSSLVEALDLLLEEKDTTTKARVREIQPAGADVGTTVEAELTIGPSRIVYRKTWNRHPGTSLTIHTPVREQLTGQQAHDRVGRLMDDHLDRTLFKALRMMQGIPMEQAGVVSSSRLGAALDRAAGTVAQSPGDLGDEQSTAADLVTAIEAEFLTFYTPTGRPTGGYRAAIERVTGARDRTARARAALDEVAAQVERHAETTARHADLSVGLGRCGSELVRATAADRLLTTLRDDRVRTAEVADRARAEQRRWAADLRTRDTLRQRVSTRAEEVCRLAGELARLHSKAGQLEPEMAAATHGQVGDQQYQDSIEAARAARADEDELRLVAELVSLADRLGQIAADRAELASVQRRAAGYRIDAAALAGIELADRAMQLAAAQRDAAAAEVVVERRAHGTIVLGGSELPPGPGQRHHRLIVEQVEITVGAARIILRPGVDAAAHAAAAIRAEEELVEALAVVGADDVPAARAQLAARQAADAAVAAVSGRLAGRMGNDRLGALVPAADSLRGQIGQLATGRAGRLLPPDMAQARARRAEAERSAQLMERARAEGVRALRRAQDGVAALDRTLARVQAQAETADMELAAAQAELAAARAEAPEAAIEHGLGSADRAVERAAQEALLAQSAWQAADPDRIAGELHAADVKLGRARRDFAAMDGQLVNLSAQLAVIGDQGRQDLLDDALTGEQTAVDELAVLTARAEAAALLHRTVLGHRARARAAYVGPFRSRLLSMARLVHGPDLDLDIDNDLHIVSRTAAGRTVGYSMLSTGAQEQFALMSRLACAQVLAGDGGVPVILDDALGHTDPARLRSMGQVFAAAGPEAQIILLTCDPGRYAAIPGARVLRLPTGSLIGDADPENGPGGVGADLPAVVGGRPAPGRALEDPRIARVLAVLREYGPLGRPELLSRTGLTAADWPAIRLDLLDSGLVATTGAARGVRYAAA